ncbi:MAG: CoA pyrophosphatase [Flavobacteriales bacterium]|nr:CoA pyrophosphatase [Flavobacteriales bacterium]
MQLPLPGEVAHRKAMSYSRQRAVEARRNSSPRESAVMALMFQEKNELQLVFIVRPGGSGVHSGQVAFPGGARDAEDNDLRETALRELFEETGLDSRHVEMIGELSEVYIPPSNFVVKPFVGYCHEVPQFTPSADEVDLMLTEPLSNLLLPDAVQLKSTYLPKYEITMDVPSFDIQGYQLWGATAMMVMELRDLLLAGMAK